MLSVGLWRWYINITLTILDSFHRPAFYLKQDVSEIGFYVRLQVEPTQLGPERGDSSIYWAQLSSFRLNMGGGADSNYGKVVF
jgi:hypothetical protein